MLSWGQQTGVPVLTHNKYQDSGPRLLTPALSTVWLEIAYSWNCYFYKDI